MSLLMGSCILFAVFIHDWLECTEFSIFAGWFFHFPFR